MGRLLLICLLTWAGIVAAQEHGRRGGGNHGMEGGQHRMHSMLRHQYVRREGLPAEYQQLENPLIATDTVLANGQRIYTETCAACHGTEGNGDGAAGEALEPAPSNIRRLPRMPMMSSDAYLYWTVAEGGTPIESAMPAFGEALTPDEIWSVIHYVRAL